MMRMMPCKNRAFSISNVRYSPINFPKGGEVLADEVSFRLAAEVLFFVFSARVAKKWLGEWLCVLWIEEGGRE